MTSVSPSRGRSPHSPYDQNTYDQNSDGGHSWEYVDYSSGGSNPSSVGFLPSPSSGSLNGYAIVGHMIPPTGTPQGSSASPPASSLSPMFLNLDSADISGAGPFNPPPCASYPAAAQMEAYAQVSAPVNGNFAGANMQDHLLATHGFLILDEAFGAPSTRISDNSMLLASDISSWDTFPPHVPDVGFTRFDAFGNPSTTLQSPTFQQHPNSIPVSQSPSPLLSQPNQSEFANIQVYQHDVPHRQWTPESGTLPAHATALNSAPPAPPPARSPIIIHESGYSASPHYSSSSSGTTGSPHSIDPMSPNIKEELGHCPPETPIRKVKSGKVEKRKSDSSSKFVIMTPNTISASAGKPNPYECFEAMRSTQRGRKGPLANDTKESALQVRRLGACFCCHSRKVKCDKERPCKNCTKLAATVSQVVCWQFQDFMTVLFPEFMREHFRKDQMSKFMADHVDGIIMQDTIDVELFSGASFGSVLRLPAKVFRPKTSGITKHYHLMSGKDRVNLLSCSSAPLVLELDTNVQKEALKKAAKDYILALTKEPSYVTQTTDTIRHTDIPQRVLTLVEEYAKRSDSAMVKRALAIYSAHYIMTRHLCLTEQTTNQLRARNLIPHGTMYMTPRVANRQIKAVIDELLTKDMQSLFENFSKSLKPKSKREWAPCLAAFLVLCLFIESVETAADNFVITSNEISMREQQPLQFKREDALALNRDVENLPFKQFAYQFHQIYQTHSKDVSTKPYNPLVDDSQLDFSGTEDPKAALDMTNKLRQLIQRGPGGKWDELDFLSADLVLSERNATHPYPRDVSLTYTGRLVARFLLSFTHERYIFEGGALY